MNYFHCRQYWLFVIICYLIEIFRESDHDDLRALRIMPNKRNCYNLKKTRGVGQVGKSASRPAYFEEIKTEL